MDVEVIGDLKVKELIGGMVRDRKARAGAVSPEFQTFVVEQILPEVISKVSKIVTAKRVHRLEGQYLSVGKQRKPARKAADSRGDSAPAAAETGGQ